MVKTSLINKKMEALKGLENEVSLLYELGVNEYEIKYLLRLRIEEELILELD